MGELITTYWWLFIAIFATGCVIGNYIINFFKLPSSSQIAKIKEWLLWAVAAAEKELGSGTGQLKLRYVYGMFTQTWTNVAKVITFEAFSELVDEDGDFDAKYTNDGLHPNTMGYAKITRVLLPYVYE